MRERTLAALTTLRLGGPAGKVVEVATDADLVAAVSAADAAGEPVLVVGGGSNLVVADEGFPGTVVLVRTTGVVVDSDAGGGALVRVAAGEVWDDVVVRAVSSGWVGVEALSGIPGRCGAVPIQNVGAYGQDVAQTIATVHTWDRRKGCHVTWVAADCGFGYRTSRFKLEPDRHVVLSVEFRLRLGALAAPVTYPELARRLGLAVGARPPVRDVREAVVALRRGKGMVLDDLDHDTWSAGSFFTNPMLTCAQAAALPADAPQWPQPDGMVKTSAAWLIEHAGFGKGYGTGPVRLSAKHPLALTNRGSATTKQLLELAREIRDGVWRAFGIELVNEPVTVGCRL
ncbi:MAG: UDP-N-acetylmuramate dehydrogenase [Nocardioidaceae bacterium]